MERLRTFSAVPRAQGVDWRDERLWDCNSRLDPLLDGQADGTALDPLETLFVAMGHFAVETGKQPGALREERSVRARDSCWSEGGALGVMGVAMAHSCCSTTRRQNGARLATGHSTVDR